MAIFGKRGSVEKIPEKRAQSKGFFKECKEVMDKILTSPEAQKQMELVFSGKENVMNIVKV